MDKIDEKNYRVVSDFSGIDIQTLKDFLRSTRVAEFAELINANPPPRYKRSLNNEIRSAIKKSKNERRIAKSRMPYTPEGKKNKSKKKQGADLVDYSELSKKENKKSSSINKIKSKMDEKIPITDEMIKMKDENDNSKKNDEDENQIKVENDEQQKMRKELEEFVQRKNWRFLEKCFYDYNCDLCRNNFESGSQMFYTKKSNGETLYFDTDCIKKILIETSEVSTSKNELLKAVKKYVDSNFDPKKLYEKNEENSSKDIFSLSESDEDNLIERKLKRIPELVSRKLMQKGKTIEEINPDILDKGQESELKYADLSIWHNKEEVDKFVQNKLNLSDEIVKNTVYADGKQKLWSRVQVVITELRNEGLIKDWTDVPGGAVRTGVWRLKNSIVEKEDSVKTKRSFFTAVGPWKNWNHSKTNLPMRWGIINGPAKADYDLLNNEDIVFFYSTKTEPSPFEKKGFFGVGKVTKKFESVSPFWPDEVEKNEIFYKHQFYLEILKISEQDKDVLDWIEGLPFTKGLNHIVDEEKLNQLINNTKSKWNLDFSKSIETISGVKDDETIDEMDDVELKEINPNELEEGIKKIKDNFLVNEDTIREIVINLVGRRHIILAGPIGTGKTELARMIPRIFWKENQGYFTEEHTATADWNTTDVIGGIMPKMKDDKPTYEIQLGCVSSTIVKNWKDLTCKKRVAKKIDGKTSNGTWLLIDEFNRADIDKAFGQLFTSLESKNLKIPSSGKQSFTEIKIPKDYRIIGTLNTADKSYLFHLSDALKRRFAYIEVNPPGIEEKEYEIFYALKNAMIKDTEKNYDSLFKFDSDKKIIDKEQTNDRFFKILEKAYDVLYFVRMSKPLGTAILKSIFQTILVSSTLLNNFDKALDIGLRTNLIPQLENISPTNIETMIAIFYGDPIQFFKTINDNQNKEKYEEDLFNFLRFVGLSEAETNSYVKNFLNSKISDENWGNVQQKMKSDLKLTEELFKKSLEELQKSSTLI